MKWLSAIVLAGVSIAANTVQAKPLELRSPDNGIRFSFLLKEGLPSYSLTYKEKPLINASSLAISFTDGSLGKLEIGKPVFRNGREQYELVVGKTKAVNDEFNELVIPLTQLAGNHRMIRIIVRAFNDALAFRYEFPEQKGWDSFTLSDESTTFNFAGDPLIHALLLPNYTSSHEGFYTDTRFSNIKEGELMDMPALLEFSGPIYLGITEAALVDYAGMYLTRRKAAAVSMLSPYPGQPSIKVKGTIPHVSPWRVLLVSDHIGALIESNAITNLNAPCAIKDTGWLRPGKSTWPWWNGNVVPDTLNAPGMNFVTARYYIDFCARHNIEYHSIVEYGLHQWYTDDGIGFMPGPHSDVTRPVPGLNMKEIADYASKKGVGTRVWVHWAALYPKLDSAFTLMEKWGVNGLMIDFMDRDDQEMVNIQNEMLHKAAAHHLHVQFHGAYKPTGISRTWPNEFTREGTLNYETDKWDPKGLSPDHDIHMPFTRMLAGPTDYHLGGFRAMEQDKYRLQYTRPFVLGTRTHMLAMYVVLESYLQLVSDYPDAYEGQPGFEFITKVPTTWDETKVLDAKVNEYIVIARRKGDTWYVGAITNSKPRIRNISLTFLKEGEYSMELFSDTRTTSLDPNTITVTTQTVTNASKIELNMQSGGGAAMIIKKP